MPPILPVVHAPRVLWTLGAVMCACAVAAGSGRPARSPDDACAIQTTERIVAVGDVHGAYDQFAAILQEAKIIGADHHWTGGKSILVQTGDVVDRGPQSRKALDLLRQLEDEAEAAGGEVFALIGDHEAMRTQKYVRDSSPEEAAEFAGPESEKARQRYYYAAVDAAQAAAIRDRKPFDEDDFEKDFLESTPLGWVEMREAFQPDGEYGHWIREHDAMIIINGIVFSHGGPSEPIASMGCRSVNSAVDRDLQRVQGIDKNRMIWREDGPLWYRDLVDGDATAEQFETVIGKLKAKAIVAGHTSLPDRKIVAKFDGRMFAIDTGMVGGSFFTGGVPSALEISGDTWTAIYIGHREVLKKSARAY
jgi:hypothetical protein